MGMSELVDADFSPCRCQHESMNRGAKMGIRQNLVTWLNKKDTVNAVNRPRTNFILKE